MAIRAALAADRRVRVWRRFACLLLDRRRLRSWRTLRGLLQPTWQVWHALALALLERARRAAGRRRRIRLQGYEVMGRFSIQLPR